MAGGSDGAGAALINRDKRAAAESYPRVTGDKTPLDALVAMMSEPEIQFTQPPMDAQVIADFMHRIGLVKLRPES